MEEYRLFSVSIILFCLFISTDDANETKIQSLDLIILISLKSNCEQRLLTSEMTKCPLLGFLFDEILRGRQQIIIINLIVYVFMYLTIVNVTIK